MNLGALRQFAFAGVALGALAAPRSALACAACFGKSDDAMARGMNMGIFALLVVILAVLVGLASFFIFLARRSARFTQRSEEWEVRSEPSGVHSSLLTAHSSPSLARPSSISQTTP